MDKLITCMGLIVGATGRTHQETINTCAEWVKQYPHLQKIDLTFEVGIDEPFATVENVRVENGEVFLNCTLANGTAITGISGYWGKVVLTDEFGQTKPMDYNEAYEIYKKMYLNYTRGIIIKCPEMLDEQGNVLM